MDKYNNNNGRKMSSRFPCPKCRALNSKVRRTGEDHDGVITRRHRCQECGHEWYTAQEPAWIVPDHEIRWLDNSKPVWRPNA